MAGDSRAIESRLSDECRTPKRNLIIWFYSDEVWRRSVQSGDALRTPRAALRPPNDLKKVRDTNCELCFLVRLWWFEVLVVAMGTFPNVASQFGQPAGNRRAIAPRRGVIMSKRQKRELQRAVLAAEAVAQVVGPAAEPFSGDALALFRSVYSNTHLPLDLRLSAARHAAAFERPTLQAVATRDMSPATRTLEELLAEKARLATERGLALTTKPLLEGRADAVVCADEHA